MKKNELAKLKDKTAQELLSLVAKKRQEVSETYAKIKAGQEKNLKAAKLARRELAQILTIIKEKEIVNKEVSKQQK